MSKVKVFVTDGRTDGGTDGQMSLMSPAFGKGREKNLYKKFSVKLHQTHFIQLPLKLRNAPEGSKHQSTVTINYFFTVRL